MGQTHAKQFCRRSSKQNHLSADARQQGLAQAAQLQQRPTTQPTTTIRRGSWCFTVAYFFCSNQYLRIFAFKLVKSSQLHTILIGIQRLLTFTLKCDWYGIFPQRGGVHHSIAIRVRICLDRQGNIFRSSVHNFRRLGRRLRLKIIDAWC